jgi:hypothetical protein
LSFTKTPFQAVSPRLHQMLLAWFSCTTRLTHFAIADHLGNFGGQTNFPSEAAKCSLLAQAVRCTTMRSLSMDLAFSLSSTIVFDGVCSALNSGQASSRLCELDIANCGLPTVRVLQFTQALSQLPIARLDLSKNSIDDEILTCIGSMRRLKSLRLLSVKLASHPATLDSLFEFVATSRTLESVAVSLHKSLSQRRFMFDASQLAKIVAILCSPIATRLQSFTCKGFALADDDALVGFRDNIDAAIADNHTLVHLDMYPLLSATPTNRQIGVFTRNRFAQWESTRNRIAKIAFAMAELDLPAYVLLEIIDAIDAFFFTRHGPKIACLVLVKRAWMQKQTTDQVSGQDHQEDQNSTLQL